MSSEVKTRTRSTPAGRARPSAVALAALLVLAPPGAARARAQSPSPAETAPTFQLPSWLQIHAEQRTRYETLDKRYRPTEVGADQQLDFRTRFQARIGTRRAWFYSETQDARVALDDTASTINASFENRTKQLQLYGGLGWQDLGARKIAVTVEGGRLTRDLGGRRLFARNGYRNTTTAFDGVMARVSAATWSVQALAMRPVFYTYPDIRRDPRFDSELFGGLYLTSTASRRANLDGYYLLLSDGHTMPLAQRRRYQTPGGRVFGRFGPDNRVEYEVEAAVQWGTLGTRAHRAWFEHSRLGYSWPSAWLRPRALVMWDYASGDRNPRDAASGTFDALFGDRRAELGPVGLYGLITRANLNSPAAQLFIRPHPSVDFYTMIRGVWLAQATDRWYPSGLADPTGASGSHVGRQTEFRLRYRFGRHLEFDGGLVFFSEGRFVRALKPSPKGRATFVYFGTDVRF